MIDSVSDWNWGLCIEYLHPKNEWFESSSSLHFHSLTLTMIAKDETSFLESIYFIISRWHSNWTELTHNNRWYWWWWRWSNCRFLIVTVIILLPFWQSLRGLGAKSNKQFQTWFTRYFLFFFYPEVPLKFFFRMNITFQHFFVSLVNFPVDCFWVLIWCDEAPRKVVVECRWIYDIWRSGNTDEY